MTIFYAPVALWIGFPVILLVGSVIWETVNPAWWVPQGYATGASKGLSTADLPDHAYWETWFPADWVSEMREQVRLWFYSQLFMSVALVGTAPFKTVLGYEKMLAEDGRLGFAFRGTAEELRFAGPLPEHLGAGIYLMQLTLAEGGAEVQLEVPVGVARG